MASRSRYIAVARGAAGRGHLRRERIVPGGVESALTATRKSVEALAPWREAVGACRSSAALRKDIEQRAALARAGRAELFGEEAVAVGVPPRWSTDPHSGHSWPAGHHRRLDHVNRRLPSDVKAPWELSRLRPLVALAQAGSVLDDDASLDALELYLRDWHDRNPLGWSVNWACAMEVALRAVNLICVDGILTATRPDYPSRPLLVSSLYQHGWFLFRNLEISDVNGNHFVADAVGLVWLGRYFGGIGEAGRWHARGCEMVLEAARDQVLEDGLDHEGSLPYHVLVLEMLLVGLAAGGEQLSGAHASIEAMLEAAASFVDGNGRVPNVGDDDGGRVMAFCDVPSRDGRRVLSLGAALTGHRGAAVVAAGAHIQDALWLTGPEGVARNDRLATGGSWTPTRHFHHGGLVVLGNREEHVVVDVGPVGFRGRGGHGHLDAMSFEASLAGETVVRDSGTGSYTGDPALRNELRDVLAHTVVVVDGLPYAKLGGEDRLWAVEGDSPPAVHALDVGPGGQRLVAVQELPASSGSARYERVVEWRPGMLSWRDTVWAPAGSSVTQLVQLPDGCQLVGNRVESARFDYHVDQPPGALLELQPCRRSDRYASVHPGWRAVITCQSRGEPLELSWLVRPR